VIVVFWRAEQERCLKALTALQSIYLRFKGQVEDSRSKPGGVVALALSSDEGGLEPIRKIRQEKQLTFPMLYDKEEKAYGDYGIVVTPSTVIIDKAGKLNYYYPSYRDDFSHQISGRVEVLLGKKTLETLQAELAPVKRPERSKAEKSAKRHHNAGNRLLERGMTQSAMRQYQKAIEADPSLLEVRLHLGEIYLEQKAAGEAIVEFTEVIKTKPQSYSAYAGLSDAFFLQGELEKAIEMVQIALRLNPKLARAHYRLGRIYEAQQQIAEALKEYKIALEILLEKKAALP
jgi:tetratricopeptide (TPR) repeat protein